MRIRLVRIGAASALLVLLFLFFVPIIRPVTLTPVGALFVVVIPIAVAVAWLLSPELGKSRVARLGFAGFGLALYVLCNLLFILMGLSGGFPGIFVILAVFYGVSGALMILRARHAWPFMSEKNRSMTRG